MSQGDTTPVIERWRIEPSKEGIPLVFGDGKYPTDPPRVASELEAALHSQLEEAVSLLDELDRYVGHVNCGVVHGAPECDCGFDGLYTRVRAVVRGQ